MGATVITGANRGIGLELCRQLKAKGHDVYGLCRKPSAELKELGITVIDGVDVTDEVSLKKAVTAVGGKTVELLINNAGILQRNTLENFDFPSISQQFEVNSMAPLRVVAAFRPFLKAGSKIANITSRMGSIADNGSGSSYGYRMSKAALNAATKSLALDLKPQNIAVCVLHPGFVKTDMTAGNGNLMPSESASLLIDRMEQLSLDNSGTFWHCNGEELPW